MVGDSAGIIIAIWGAPFLCMQLMRVIELAQPKFITIEEVPRFLVNKICEDKKATGAKKRVNPPL